MNQHYSDPPPHSLQLCVLRVDEGRWDCSWLAEEKAAGDRLQRKWLWSKSKSHKASTSMAGWRWWRWPWCDGGVGHMSGMCSMWLWVVTVLWTGVTAGSLGTGGVPSSTLSAPWVSSTANALHQGPWRSCWGGGQSLGQGSGVSSGCVSRGGLQSQLLETSLSDSTLHIILQDRRLVSF